MNRKEPRLDKYFRSQNGYEEIYKLIRSHDWPSLRQYLKCTIKNQEKYETLLEQYNLCFTSRYTGKVMAAAISAIPHDSIVAKIGPLRYRDVRFGTYCIQHACYNGAPLDIIKSMIDIGGSDMVLFTDDDGDSCLHYSCYCPNVNVDVIQFLQEIGRDELLILQNSMGWTVLHAAYSTFKDEKHRVIGWESSM